MHRGIPESSSDRRNTWFRYRAIRPTLGVIMRANHMRSCVAVSDEYHVFRIRKLLEHEGLRFMYHRVRTHVPVRGGNERKRCCARPQVILSGGCTCRFSCRAGQFESLPPHRFLSSVMWAT